MGTGTAFGVSQCLGWWKAGCGYNTTAGDAAAGTVIKTIPDLSGAGNNMTLHSGSTGAKLSVYNSVNQTSGWVYNPGINIPISSLEDGLPYAEILFDGTGANVYDIPVGARPTGTANPGSNGNDMTVFNVTRAQLYSPIFMGGWQYPLSHGWVGGALDSHLGYAASTPGAGFNQPFPTADVPDFYKPTVTVCRYSGSAGSPAPGTTKLYVNSIRAENTISTTNCFNQPLGNNSAGTIAGYLGNYPGDSGLGAGAGSNPYYGFWSETVVFNSALTDSQIQTIIGQLLNGMGLPEATGTNQLIVIGDSLWKSAWGSGTGTAGIDDPFFQVSTGNYQAAYPPMYESPLYILQKWLGPTYKIVDFASPGYTAAQAVNPGNAGVYAQSMLNAVSGKKLAIVELGSNDLNSGGTVSALEANMTTLINMVHSIPVLGTTITHRGTTTNAVNTEIDTYNAWVRSGCGGLTSGTIDWAADTRLETIGSPNGNIYIRSDDNIHTRMPGAAVKAEIALSMINNLLTNRYALMM